MKLFCITTSLDVILIRAESEIEAIKLADLLLSQGYTVIELNPEGKSEVIAEYLR